MSKFIILLCVFTGLCYLLLSGGEKRYADRRISAAIDSFKLTLIDGAFHPQQSREYALYVEVQQWYNHYSLTYQVGELSITSVNDTARELFWWKFSEYPLFRTVFNDNQDSFADTIRTCTFMIKPDDTIRFYHSIILEPLSYGGNPPVDTPWVVPDSMSYSMELVNAETGDILLYLKNVIVPPVNGTEDLFRKMVDSWYSGNSIDSVVIVNTVPNTIKRQQAFIRLIPKYHGPYDRRLVVRADREKWRKSLEYEGFLNPYRIRRYDSLISHGFLGKYGAWSSRPSHFGASLRAYPSLSNSTIDLEYRLPSRDEITFVIVSAETGNEIKSKVIHPSSLSGVYTFQGSDIRFEMGSYFVLLLQNEKLLVFTRMSIGEKR